MKRQLFATAAAILTATTALVVLLCLMGQGNPPTPHLALAAPMAAPTVTAVDPPSAPNDLDAPVVITGTGFAAGLDGSLVITPPTVWLGNTPLPDAGWVSSTTLTATVPWGLDPGVYTLTVTNPDGQSGSKPNAFTVTQGIGVWTTGGPYGGSIGQIVINPFTPTTLYAASGIGVFRSLDSGNHWKLVLADGGRVAMDAVSPEILYVARSNSRKGLARSEDGGDTWATISTPEPWGNWVDSVFAHPSLSGTIYIGKGEYLWKSPDRGQTWVDWTNGLTDTEYGAMAFHPTNPLTMYVSTSNGNVFHSVNGGESWEFIGQPDTCLQHLAVNPFGAHELWATGSGGCGSGYLVKYDSATWVRALPEGVSSIAFDRNISGTIWVGSGPGGNKSTDGGQTWAPIGGLAGEEINAWAIHPSNSDIVYAGCRANGIYKTTDGGATWQQTNDGLAAVVPNGLAPVLGEPGTLYAMTDMGVMKTTQGGSAWIRLTSQSENPIVVDPFTPTRIYVGNYIGENGGAMWHYAPLTAPLQYEACCWLVIRALLAIPTQPGHLVLGVGFWDRDTSHQDRRLIGGIYTSTDYGETWAWVDMSRVISWVVALAYDPANPTVIYAATGIYNPGSNGVAVLKSADGGNTWQESRVGLEDDCSLSSIAVEPVSPHRVFVSSGCSNALRVSTDGGSTWTRTNSPGARLQHLVFAPGEPPVLYAGTPQGLYRTWDGAQSWEQSAGILGSATVHALAIVTTTDRTIVYAATAGGVVTTTAQVRSLATSSETLLDAGVYRYTTRVVGLQEGSISGPATGLVQHAHTFTALVNPTTATGPIRYEWQATNQSPVTHTTGSLSDSATLTWTTPGAQVITVTATNAGGAVSVTHIVIINAPLSAVDISGPAKGLVNTAYIFTASANPIFAALPITYEWQATGQPLMFHASGVSDTLVFTWTTPGVKVIAVTANNDSGAHVVSIHTITVEQYHIYLPVVLRGG